MKLEITSERVLEAAKSCPDVKRALTALFPEVFATTKTVPKIKGERYIFPADHPMRTVIQVGCTAAPTDADAENGLFLNLSDGYTFELTNARHSSGQFLRVIKT